MKKIICLLICVLMLLGISLTGCQEHGTPSEGIQGNISMKGTLRLGKFINCVAVTPAQAEATINNAGMSGLRSSIHLHSSKAEDAYVTDSAPTLIYDFGTIQRLGYLYIWNLNADGMLDSGLKEITVEYSVDGVNYTALTKEPIVLARALELENKAYSGNAANNQDDGSRTPIDFGGVNARYVRITALSNYGGSQYGLSEVRFFSYKVRPAKGEQIMAFSTAPNAEEKSENIANGVNIVNGQVSSSAETAWSAEKGRKIENNFVILDLDGSYPVDKLRIYNYNVEGAYDCGMKTFTIQYTTESPNAIKYVGTEYIVSYSGCDWQLLCQNVEIAASDENGCAYVDVDFGGMNVQYIKIIPESNYGGEQVGISAVQVIATTGIATEPEYQWSGLFSNEGSFPYQKSLEMGSNGIGWLGADGIYSLNLNGTDIPGSASADTRTMWIFSDTFMGNFNNYSDGYGVYGNSMKNGGMVNHSFAYLIGNEPDPRNLSFWMHSGDSTGNIIPARDWLTDLVRIENKVYMYGMRFNSIWMPDSMDLVRVELDDKYVPKLESAPYMREDADILLTKDGYDYVFGAGIFDNTAAAAATPDPDGYIYIFGYRSKQGSKNLVVARTKPENMEKEANWEYYTGSEWKQGIENVGVIGNVEVSSEFSIQYMWDGMYAGKFALIFTELCESGNIMMTLSDSITGRWDYDTTITLYHCNDPIDLFGVTGDKAMYAYNAKAHPHLSAEGELLISYNMNSHDFSLTDSSKEYLYPHFVVMFEIKE